MLQNYSSLKQELEMEDNIGAVGTSCLNELHFSDTTPCLAWKMLFEGQDLIWGCEAETVSMLKQYILYKSLGVPIMMTNLDPFLLGQAAPKHERIPAFPDISKPENHILVAHCGYLRVVPQAFSTEWILRK